MESRAILLVAEDDDDDFFLAREALKIAEIDCKVLRLTDGEKVLSYLKSEGEFSDREKYPFPDVLLLDLNMPKIDGREVLKKVKGDEKLKRLPVVVFTTSKTEEDVIKAYMSGSNSYIRKPVNFNAMVNIFKSLGEYWLNTVDLPK